nr:uncharacterized protein LOC129451392 [Misgurnus anguillicaudatus]
MADYEELSEYFYLASHQDPEPYRFEPEYTDEELQTLEADRQVVEQTEVEGRIRTNTNWWCKCGTCQPMMTEAECLCCCEWDQVLPSMARLDEDENICVTTTQDFSALIHPAVVDFFSRCDKINWKKRPMPSEPNGQLTNNQYRLVSYRIVLEWALKGETLGRSNRKPLPSCVVGVIRRKYPSETGVYVGFQEAEEAIEML